VRYSKRMKAINDELLYEDHFIKRKVRFIEQFTTPKLMHPSIQQMKNLTNVRRVWKQGDRYYKLAHEYYNDSKLWWVIAWYNKKPTEAHLNLGDIVYVPLPLQEALKSYGLYY